MANSSSNKRLNFLRAVLDTIEEGDFKKVKNLVTNALKRKKRKASQAVPALDDFTPESENAIGWWRKWRPSDVVSFDTESVELLQPHPQTGQLSMVAEISMVDIKGETVLNVICKIQHILIINISLISILILYIGESVSCSRKFQAKSHCWLSQ